MAYNERLANPRYELVGGRRVLQTRQALNHAIVQGNLNVILHTYFKGKQCKLFGRVDVYFDEDNHYIPDLLIVCDPDKIKPARIEGAPDLIVEILSPRTSRNDFGIKKDTYEKYGVKEYWLVNPMDKSISVYHLKDGRYKLDNVYTVLPDYELEDMSEEEKAEHSLSLKVSLYDDLVVDVAEVFEGMLPS